MAEPTTDTDTELLAACTEALARLEDARKAVSGIPHELPDYYIDQARHWIYFAKEEVRKIMREHSDGD